MKNLILLSVLLANCIYCSAKVLSPSESASLYHHMYEVNTQWDNFKSACPNAQLSFNSEEERIQMHLDLVIKHLSKNASPELSAEQLKNRSQLLEALRVYKDYGQFPLNSYHEARTPYFIDAYGTHCAVGYLMAYSGHIALSIQISDNQNFDYLVNIKHPELNSWALEYGFSFDELKWIQPGYNPETTFSPVGAGTNGEVLSLASYYNNSSLDNSFVIAGQFDSLDNTACLNIGKYEDDQLSCLGNGIAGIVKDVAFESGKFYACGELNNAQTLYPLAIYDTSWHFLEIPDRAGAYANCFHVSWGHLYIAISHESIGSGREIWSYTADDQWELLGTVDGTINDIEVGQYEVYFGGQFSELISGGVTISVENSIVYKEKSTNNWHSLTGELPFNIKCIKSIGANIYIAGNCTRSTSGEEVCAARYLNGVVQPIVFADYFSGSDISINSVTAINQNSLVFGGNFFYNGFPNARNLAYYNLLNANLAGLGVFDKNINSVISVANELYLGGDFSVGNFTSLNHLAKLEEPLATIGKLDKSSFVVSPNPFSDQLLIDGIEGVNEYEIFDLNGKLIVKGELSNQRFNGLESLNPGVYFLYLRTENQLYSKKILKN